MTKEVSPHVKIFQVLRENDPTFAENLAHIMKEVDGEVLNKKTRELVKLGISSVLGRIEGVKIHSRKARELGASKEEIAEVVRIVFLSSGVPGLYSAINAYEEENKA